MESEYNQKNGMLDESGGKKYPKTLSFLERSFEEQLVVKNILEERFFDIHEIAQSVLVKDLSSILSQAIPTATTARERTELQGAVCMAEKYYNSLCEAGIMHPLEPPSDAKVKFYVAKRFVGIRD